MEKKAYSVEEIESIKQQINNMDHRSMCSLWRSAPTGHPYFNNTLPFVEIFKERLFKHFGGFTPEISKSIGF